MRLPILLLLAAPAMLGAQTGPPGTGAGACAPAGARAGIVERVRPYDDSIALGDGPARLVGQVVNVADHPLSHGLIALRRGLTDAGDVAGAVTDSLGGFALDGLAPGEYVLHVRRIGYQQQWHAVRLVGAAVDTICLRLRATPIGLMPLGLPTTARPADASRPARRPTSR